MADPALEPPISTLRLGLAYGLLALAALGLTASLIWLLRRGRASLFPLSRLPRPRRITWSGAEVVLAFVFMRMIPAMAFLSLQITGFYRFQYGSDPGPDDKELLNRCSLWAAAVGTPLAVAAILGTLRVVSRTKLRHIALTRRRWLPALTAGCLTWLVIAPPVFGLHFLVIWAQEKLGLEAKKHVLEQVLENQPRPAEWVLVVLVAVALAPVLEELVFRGILQPWLAKQRWRWLFAWVAALMVSGLNIGWSVESWLPHLFILVTGAACALVTAFEPGPRWPAQAIAGSALLFAAMHSEAWPTPVPLFFLALALGWLAYRCRNLIAPIVLHSLFNSISTLILLMGWQ
jgi:membrane protease YdiL (CAAX protease family)